MLARQIEVRPQPALPSALLGAALLVASSVGACSDDSETPVGGKGGEAAVGGAGGRLDLTSSSSAMAGGSPPLPETFSVSGVVVDQDGAPVEGAIVMQGGGEIALVTGADGSFTVELTQSIPGVPTAVAAKVGYRADGVELEELPTDPITLTLRIVNPPDNALGYDFGEPGVGDPKEDNSTLFCGHCHTTFAAQFQKSKHAGSAKNPIVHDLYAGVASALEDEAACDDAFGIHREGAMPGEPGTMMHRCYIGNGVLPDLNACGAPGFLACDNPEIQPPEKPTAFGGCADCHAFGMDGPQGGRDFLEAEGVGFENGNHCDACHHVRDIDLSLPPGAGGRLVMQRPREKLGKEIGAPLRQAIFGPYPDVPNQFMGGSYQPKFATAEFCAGCHEQKQAALLPATSLDPDRFPDGLPTHSTYSEWLAGPFNTETTPCQFCHMPPIDGLVNPLDVATESDLGIVFGFARDPEELRAHTFRGPLFKEPAVPRLLDGALTLSIAADQTGAELSVDVTVANTGCGHAVPTGEPMRAMILLVEVDGCGERFDATGGLTVSDIGGATAPGAVGGDVTVAGTTITWPTAVATPGDVVRFVRPSGSYWDYDGVGLFEGSTLTPFEKGMPILEPVAQATVVSVGAGSLIVDTAVTVLPGDLVFLGDALPADLAVADGEQARSLSGAPGVVFSRVMLDPLGVRNAPHYRAIDIASDSRIRPGESATTTHSFAIPAGCLQADVHATVLYRPLPLRLAAERAWDARDYVATEETESVTLLP
ncbi:MAG: carboxypeptidase regulatory-like domain-containing protein [Myxococcales bacterium]|nr:carboxypeptidase regulatory-like domain-containing protein [Myxococcales bacterium]